MTLLPEFFISISFSCNFILLINEDLGMFEFYAFVRSSREIELHKFSFFVWGGGLFCFCFKYMILSLQVDNDTNIPVARIVIAVLRPTLELGLGALGLDAQEIVRKLLGRTLSPLRFHIQDFSGVGSAGGHPPDSISDPYSIQFP